jgi:hypothetical protein
MERDVFGLSVAERRPSWCHMVRLKNCARMSAGGPGVVASPAIRDKLRWDWEC